MGKEGEADEKEVPDVQDTGKETSDQKIDSETTVEQDSGKHEKVVEKADQECMEKPANFETAEKEKTSKESLPPGFINSFKPVEDTSDSKVDVKADDKPSTPAHDDIAPITSAPTVITLDNDQ